MTDLERFELLNELIERFSRFEIPESIICTELQEFPTEDLLAELKRRERNNKSMDDTKKVVRHIPLLDEVEQDGVTLKKKKKNEV